MLLEAPIYKEIYGAVRIFETQKVLKLDTETQDVQSYIIQHIPRDQIYQTLEEMTIVVPIRNERLPLLDGVLKAIPHKCSIVVISNSKREGPNNFKQEVELIKSIYNLTHSKIIVIHQKDEGLGKAFEETGYTHILDENGIVKSGKGEGMIAGILLAKALGSKYVGFIDADNYIPGAVNEYVKDYAAGFLMADTDYTMVRLVWRHKPKIVKRRLYFKKWGRVSEITNKYLNLLIGVATGFETDIIHSGNSGEHAISIKLADIMEFSTGYSIEPFQLVYLLQKFGIGPSSLPEEERESYKEVFEKGIDIFQIETLNPHIHEDKGQEHIREMVIMSLCTIYHSGLLPDLLKDEILRGLQDYKILKSGTHFEKPTVYPSIKSIDVNKWLSVLEANSKTLLKFHQ